MIARYTFRASSIHVPPCARDLAVRRRSTKNSSFQRTCQKSASASACLSISARRRRISPRLSFTASRRSLRYRVGSFSGTRCRQVSSTAAFLILQSGDSSDRTRAFISTAGPTSAPPWATTCRRKSATTSSKNMHIARAITIALQFSVALAAGDASLSVTPSGGRCMKLPMVAHEAIDGTVVPLSLADSDSPVKPIRVTTNLRRNDFGAHTQQSATGLSGV